MTTTKKKSIKDAKPKSAVATATTKKRPTTGKVSAAGLPAGKSYLKMIASAIFALNRHLGCSRAAIKAHIVANNDAIGEINATAFSRALKQGLEKGVLVQPESNPHRFRLSPNLRVKMNKALPQSARDKKARDAKKAKATKRPAVKKLIAARLSQSKAAGKNVELSFGDLCDFVVSKYPATEQVDNRSSIERSIQAALTRGVNQGQFTYNENNKSYKIVCE